MRLRTFLKRVCRALEIIDVAENFRLFSLLLAFSGVPPGELAFW